MEEKLVAYLKELTFQHFQRITFPLLSVLKIENCSPLKDPVFIEFFNKYCLNKKIKEFYLIDKQGSFLCIDENSNRFNFVVHTDNSLDEWLRNYSFEGDLADHLISSIENRQKIPFFGLGKEAWELEKTEIEKCFYQPNFLKGNENYYWVEIK